MADNEEKTLERIADVYEEAVKNPPFEYAVEKLMAQVEHLYSLHFNPYTPQAIPERIAKKVFQSLTRPLFVKQVAYNSAVRELLLQTTNAVEELQRDVKTLFDQQRLTQEASASDARSTGETTEDIVEDGFFLQSLARLFPRTDISLLSLGRSGSVLPYRLASLGYGVTALDNDHKTPAHPNLKFVGADLDIDDLAPESFDCIMAPAGLSGGGAEHEGRDVVRLERIHRLMKPGGYLLLTMPCDGWRTPSSATHDKRGWAGLLQPLEVHSLGHAIRSDDGSSLVLHDETPSPHENESRVVLSLLVCKKEPAPSAVPAAASL